MIKYLSSTLGLLTEKHTQGFCLSRMFYMTILVVVVFFAPLCRPKSVVESLKTCCRHTITKETWVVLKSAGTDHQRIFGIRDAGDQETAEVFLNFEIGKQAILFSRISTANRSKMLTHTIVLDFLKEKSYRFTPNTTAGCVVKPLNNLLYLQCVPDFATYIGSNKSDQVVNYWRSDHPDVGMKVTLGFTGSACVPVYRKESGPWTTNGYSEEEYKIEDYSEGISDPNVFDLPSSCSHLADSVRHGVSSHVVNGASGEDTQRRKTKLDYFLLDQRQKTINNTAFKMYPKSRKGKYRRLS